MILVHDALYFAGWLILRLGMWGAEHVALAADQWRHLSHDIGHWDRAVES